MKLSKEQRKKHQQAEVLLSKEELTFDDKVFVLNNWLPGEKNDIGKIASFFTPSNMAWDFCIETGIRQGSIIDLCAGIGMLSFQMLRFTNMSTKITCLEINEQFVEVGKKIIPEANWICGDVMDQDLIKSIGTFDYAISNPPFGNVKTGSSSNWLKYRGNEFEYKVIEIGSNLANYRGTFILPQSSCPFRISGTNYYKDGPAFRSKKYETFDKQSNLSLTPNNGFDLSIYQNEWVGTNVLCEFAHCEYEELRIQDITVETEAKYPIQGSLF
ncbi:MAG: hypothetical protein PEPC_01813 [Peptostreptococcus russellii]